jgi:type I restriction enzyme S subunit
VIADLKPYTAYKETRLNWLSAVPAHWKVQRIKSVLREVDSRSSTGLETLFSLRMHAGLVDHHARGGKQIPPSALVGYKRVLTGEIVMNRMRASLGLFAGATTEGLVSPDYAIFRQTGELSVAYAVQLFRTPAMTSVFRIESTGLGTGESGFLRLYSDQFGRLAIPIPPADEQAAIVRFLGWANGQLERAIRAKRKVIALLNEQKQAIIHRAVTRGLDPSVRLKPSGVQLLGDIPTHWQVRKLRTLVHRIEQGVSPLATGFLAEGDSWGVLKSGCVNRGAFRETEHKQLARDFEIDPSIVVKVGDVLISRASGSPSLVGSVGRVRSLHYRLILSDKTFRACFRNFVDQDFIVFAMNASHYRHQVEQAISGAEGMANNLPLSALRDFSFAIPPEFEAAQIAEYLETATASRQATISRFEREIDLLIEYRTRLIADVVTGQLDVREAATLVPDDVPLSDLAEAPDDIDDPETADEEAIS